MGKTITPKICIVILSILVCANFMLERVALSLIKSNIFLQNPVFSLELVFNKGAAFSLFDEHTIFLTLFSLFVAIALFTYLYKSFKVNLPIENIAFSILIAGILGNFFERLVYGYVIDYIRLTFIDFPIFNFSDILITVATVMIIFSMTISRRKTIDNGIENN